MIAVESTASLIFVREVPVDMPGDTPDFKRDITGLTRGLVFGMLGRLLLKEDGRRLAANPLPSIDEEQLPPDILGVELRIPIPADEGRITPVRLWARMEGANWRSPGTAFGNLADPSWGLAPPVARLTEGTGVPPFAVFNGARQEMIAAFARYASEPPTMTGLVGAIAAIGDAGVDGAFFAMGMYGGSRPQVVLPG